MTSKLESPIWSRDTHHRILCFDKVQLTIKWTSNIKDAHWSMDAILRDVVFRLRSGHAPPMHVASHANHEKRVGWFSTSMLARGSVPIVMWLRLAARRAPLLTARNMINEPIRKV